MTGRGGGEENRKEGEQGVRREIIGRLNEDWNQIWKSV